MEEKILMLMEETGCEQGEAQLAMELANYDLEKAIKAIKSILRNIIVVKGRFFAEQKNLFGIFVIIFDQRKESIIRITGVVSYNPVIYEHPLATDWHLLEKSIYSFRLLEGSVLEVMKDTESRFNKNISEDKDKFYKALSDRNESKISEILFSGFSMQDLKTQINIEEINLADYHQEQPAGEDNRDSGKLLRPDSNRLMMDVEILENENGRKAVNISPGDVVFAHITDGREIAKYLSKLLGTGETPYMPVPVEEIEEDENGLKLKLYFTPGIAGLIIVPKNARFKVADDADNRPFLKKLFGMK